MTVALVASSTSGATDAQTASRTVPVPAGAASGHVAVIELETWLDTSTDPVIDWAAIGFTQIAYVESSDGFTRLYIARKVLTSAETGTWNMTWTGSYWNQAQCTLWSGVDNTTPLDVAVNTAVTAANTTMPAVSVTTVTAGCGMIHVVSNENSATGTAPTGYTEQQEANYLRTNTKVAGSAGAETPAGGSISVSTVKLGALVALRAAGGGGTTPANPATETDTAQAAGRIRATTAGTVTETDVAQPAGRTRTTSAGAAAETELALPAGRIRATAAGTALETDTAVGIGVPNVTPAGPALETETALPAGRVRSTAAGAAVETEQALTAGRIRVTPAGAAAEDESALPAGRTRTTLAGAALESDTAQPIGSPTPPPSDLLLYARVESQWHAYIEPNPYAVEVEA